MPLSGSPGYILFEKLIPDDLVDRIVAKMPEVDPARAVYIDNNSNRAFQEGSVRELSNIEVWWSHGLLHWPEFQELSDIITPIAQQHLPGCDLFTGDMVVINPGSDWFWPHLDAPHRMEPWNNTGDFLGIQCVISLQDLTKDHGSTALVPNSHNQGWDMHVWANAGYHDYFTENHIRLAMPKGSVLMCNATLLHSGMPSRLPEPRPAILFNYVLTDLFEEMKKIDHIWNRYQDYKQRHNIQ